MRSLIIDRRLHRVATVAIGVGLLIAAGLQRQTIADALVQMKALSVTTLAIMAVLAVTDRALRAEVIRSLLPQLSFVWAEVVGDVGAAATKGLPLGGPVGSVLRWQIAKERGVDAAAFLTMLVASGVAAAFTSWTFALVATTIDAFSRSVDTVDLTIIGISSAVLVGAVIFWLVLLRSDSPQDWLIARSSWIVDRLRPLLPALEHSDPKSVVTRLRSGLRTIAGRPVPLLSRTAVAQANGALILWVALQGLGVEPELGHSEFLRIFFVVHVVGSFAPTPGGVGLFEAGLTGALVAAGVDSGTALAGVLIYRFITYVLPIIIGTVLFVVWRRLRLKKEGTGGLLLDHQHAHRPSA